MGKIDDYVIQRIKETAKIYDVVSDFVKLRKTGVRYTGICPFHDDKHDGNFIVYPQRNVFKCFTCDAKGGPIEFLIKYLNISFVEAIRWLGKKYSIETDNVPIGFTLPPLKPSHPPLPMLTLPMAMVRAREHIENDTLVNWMRTGIHWDMCQRARLEQNLKDYHIGHARNGMTIFWQIDEHGVVRTGKLMRYKSDGHRDKSEGYNKDWIHAIMSRCRFIDPNTYEMKQCLFGLHLLDAYKTNMQQDVCIVESEKTALLMATAYGNHPKQVWMACGGLENINNERLQPIIAQKRRIILYPDRDGVEKWRAKADRIAYDNIVVDARPVRDWWQPCDGPKADIADVVIRIINENISK